MFSPSSPDDEMPNLGRFSRRDRDPEIEDASDLPLLSHAPSVSRLPEPVGQPFSELDLYVAASRHPTKANACVIAAGCQDFCLTEIQSTERPEVFLHCVLDVSGSMSWWRDEDGRVRMDEPEEEGVRRIDKLQELLKMVLNGEYLKGDDGIEIVTFSTSGRLKIRFERLNEAADPDTPFQELPNVQAVLKVVDDLRAGGGTLIHEGARLTKRSQDPKRVELVWVFTDGESNKPEQEYLGVDYCREEFRGCEFVPILTRLVDDKQEAVDESEDMRVMADQSLQAYLALDNTKRGAYMRFLTPDAFERKLKNVFFDLLRPIPKADMEVFVNGKLMCEHRFPIVRQSEGGSTLHAFAFSLGRRAPMTAKVEVRILVSYQNRRQIFHNGGEYLHPVDLSSLGLNLCALSPYVRQEVQQILARPGCFREETSSRYNEVVEYIQPMWRPHISFEDWLFLHGCIDRLSAGLNTKIVLGGDTANYSMVLSSGAAADLLATGCLTRTDELAPKPQIAALDRRGRIQALKDLPDDQRFRLREVILFEAREVQERPPAPRRIGFFARLFGGGSRNRAPEPRRIRGGCEEDTRPVAPAVELHSMDFAHAVDGDDSSGIVRLSPQDFHLACEELGVRNRYADTHRMPRRDGDDDLLPGQRPPGRW